MLIQAYLINLDIDVYSNNFLIKFRFLYTLGTLFVYFVVPETKGKSAEEIKALFATRSTNPRRSDKIDNNYDIEYVLWL